jgi:hypothetical protein
MGVYDHSKSMGAMNVRAGETSIKVVFSSEAVSIPLGSVCKTLEENTSSSKPYKGIIKAGLGLEDPLIEKSVRPHLNKFEDFEKPPQFFLVFDGKTDEHSGVGQPVPGGIQDRAGLSQTPGTKFMKEL